MDPKDLNCVVHNGAMMASFIGIAAYGGPPLLQQWTRRSLNCVPFPQIPCLGLGVCFLRATPALQNLEVMDPLTPGYPPAGGSASCEPCPTGPNFRAASVAAGESHHAALTCIT